MPETWEISPGDLERIEEIKEMLRSGKREEEIKHELKSRGYLDYHIDFLIARATGKKRDIPVVVIEKPKEDKQKAIRFYLMIALAIGALALGIYLAIVLKK